MHGYKYMCAYWLAVAKLIIKIIIGKLLATGGSWGRPMIMGKKKLKLRMLGNELSQS